MRSIENKDIKRLVKLLLDTRNVTKLKIKNLKWSILRLALEKLPAEFRFDNLEKLDISYNYINGRVIQDINNLLFSRMSSLTSLHLGSNHIGVAGALAIANSPHMAMLNSLNLRGNQIGNEGATAISNLTSLTNLNLGSNRIGNKGARALANSPHMARLTILNLGWNQIGYFVEAKIEVRLNEINPKCVVVF
jgi:hypothetical protein